MAHGGRTAVNIRGFYSTVRCCNQGKAVAPRCLSGFDYVPTQSTSLFDSLTCPWSRNRRRDRGQIHQRLRQNFLFRPLLGGCHGFHPLPGSFYDEGQLSQRQTSDIKLEIAVK